MLTNETTIRDRNESLRLVRELCIKFGFTTDMLQDSLNDGNKIEATSSLQTLIDAEFDYFNPILDAANRITVEQLNVWRKETVSQRQERVSTEVFDLFEGTVKYGPFRGLHLDKDTWWGKLDLASMCLGQYEKEILNFIVNIKPQEYSSFIDIGAADGYYACGMLYSGKVDKAICFEQNKKGQTVITSNWQKNGSVGTLAVHGEANEKSFSLLPPEDLKNAFVLIDIEGGEFELLTSAVLKSLRSSTLILEVHSGVENFLCKYEKLLRDAHPYFDIDIIDNVNTSKTQFRELRHFTDDNRQLLNSERRPCLMRFLKLTPKIFSSSFV